MTLMTGRIPRKALLIGLMGIFTIGNLISALSDSYGVLMVSRLITSLNHGAFFGVGSIVAASLVAPNRRAAAVAAMFMGLTIANVGGVPLASWVGNIAGWRMAFWGITGIGVIGMAALAIALPHIEMANDVNMRKELRALGRPAVLTAFAVTVLSSGAMFTVFTYIAPILRDATGASSNFITAMLVLYGLGLTVGNWLGGKFADKSVDGTLIFVLVALTLLLLIFAVTMQWAIPAALSIFAWGVATFALVPPIQMRVMTIAADAPNVASSVNIGAFNLGNALGAALGGSVISLNLGYPAISVAGALCAASALAIVLLNRPSKKETVALGTA